MRYDYESRQIDRDRRMGEVEGDGNMEHEYTTWAWDATIQWSRCLDLFNGGMAMAWMAWLVLFVTGVEGGAVHA